MNEEPHRLTQWKRGMLPPGATFFTCARPGRSKDAQIKKVSDDLVHRWVENLPGEDGTAIVSLLGRKPDGRSEFAFYSFRGGFDLASESLGRPSFQEWLNQWHVERKIEVFEYPTIDLEPIPPEILLAISSKVLDLLSKGWTVVLVDSGGVERTGRVCKHLGFRR